MNKIERMQAVFAGKAPDYTPAGFWFHYPADLTAEEAAEVHVKLYRQLDNDIIKVMDDSFGHMVTEGIDIRKPSDWRGVRPPRRGCPPRRRAKRRLRRARRTFWTSTARAPRFTSATRTCLN